MPGRKGRREKVTKTELRRIESAMQARGIDSYALAEKLGCHRYTVQRLLAGHVNSTPFLTDIRKTLGLAKARGNYVAGRSVPLVGFVGADQKYYPDPTAGDWEGFEEVDAPPGCEPDIVAVRVRGASMEPRYEDGDILFFRKGLPFDESRCVGRDCVVKIIDGPAYVKRVERKNGRLVLTSYRGDVAPIRELKIEWAAPILHVTRR